MLKTPFKLFALIIALVASPLATANDKEIYTSTFGSVAASGHDVVAYFTESKPVKGKKKYTAKYKNANWRFSSKENLALFNASPEKYAPQYGGWCAWAVGVKGELYSTEPEQWTIVDDKLYLNYDAGVQKMWLANRDKFIDQANEKWPNLIQH